MCRTSCIWHQHIKSSMFLLNFLQHSFSITLFCHVANVTHDGDALPLERSDCFGDVLFFSAADMYETTFLAETKSYAEADALGGTGDEDDLVFKSIHVYILILKII